MRISVSRNAPQIATVAPDAAAPEMPDPDTLCVVAAIGARADEVISLALPIRCEPGVTCFFQNYVDHDASDKTRDYRCGART